MRFRSCVVGVVAMAASALVAAEAVPESNELAKSLARFLAKPLPTIEALVGVAMPPPSPMMVVASLGDDASQPDLDRGYAIGYTLNELLFGADPKLDVVAPWQYAVDTKTKNAPRGQKRDSAANAYRAAARDHAGWCAHGRASGAKPVRVELVVDGCAAGKSSHVRRWSITADTEWPGALAEMCEFASASATGELTPQARASCQRAKEIRPDSLLALARFGGPAENRAWSSLEALVAADPKFAPAAIDYLSRMTYSAERRTAYWERVGAIAEGLPQSNAVQLLAYSQLARHFGWALRVAPYPTFIAWVREHPHCYAAWLALASALAAGNPDDWPEETFLTRHLPKKVADWLLPRRHNLPNEATHTMSLALTLGIYERWPQAYRTQWQVAYALTGYGWMLRGQGFWNDVPTIGKRGFPVFIDWSEQFYQSTLRINPDADEAWTGLMIATKLNGGDWLAVFDQAVEANPHDWGLYDSAMRYAMNRWGGDAETRERIESAALANNPNAPWAKALRDRWETFDKKEK
jgi:hypothetical protein